MRIATLTAFVVLQACASRPPDWTPAARLDPNSCAAPSATAGKPWQLVSAEGYTVCVPADWRTNDGHTWQGGGGSITWGTGTPVPWPNVTGEMSVTGSVTQVTPGGQVLSQGTMPPDVQYSQGGHAECSDRHSLETVGGVRADLYHVCFGRHFTGAWWLTLGVFVSGEAMDARTADLQLQVYRSVRFGTAARP